MEKYIKVALEMYFKGCSVVQAIGIAKDAKRMEELKCQK